jgi:hypothetical protein
MKHVRYNNQILYFICFGWEDFEPKLLNYKITYRNAGDSICVISITEEYSIVQVDKYNVTKLHKKLLNLTFQIFYFPLKSNSDTYMCC